MIQTVAQGLEQKQSPRVPDSPIVKVITEVKTAKISNHMVNHELYHTNFLYHGIPFFHCDKALSSER